MHKVSRKTQHTAFQSPLPFNITFVINIEMSRSKTLQGPLSITPQYCALHSISQFYSAVERNSNVLTHFYTEYSRNNEPRRRRVN